MAKVAIIADTHWGVRNDSPVFLDYFEKSTKEFFLPYLREHNIKHCIHLGDLVDRRKYINVLTASRLRSDFLQPISELGVHMHIIAGNHDEYYKDTYKVNALREFVEGRYKGIEVYSTPTEIVIEGLKVLLLPWITRENQDNSYETINNTDAIICMGHLELNGFEMQKGLLADHGDSREIFKRFESVYTGHYHHRSSVDNIHYTGAFCEHIWSDYNDPRGFSVLDTETREVEFIRNPFRMYHMIAYDDVKHPDVIEKINATDYSKYNNTYLKIVKVNCTNPYAFDMLVDKVYKESPADVIIVEDASSFIDTNPDEIIDQAQDTMTILDTYIEGLTLPVDNDKMKKYMRDIYLEAVTLETIE